MSPDPVPVDAKLAQEVLDRVVACLPSGWRVMPIGGLGMMDVVRAPGQLTRDIDLVPLIVIDKTFRIPPADEVVALANAVSKEVRLRKDQTSVEAMVVQESGAVKLELIRGRNSQAGGYFVTRKVLETAAVLSKKEGTILRPPPEVMAFLKAWAATDQDKLVEVGKDSQGFHRARAAAFRQDVSRILRDLVGRGKRPELETLHSMLDTCPRNRALRIREILRAAGWNLRSDRV